MMKKHFWKILSVLAVLALAFALAGCDGSGPSDPRYPTPPPSGGGGGTPTPPAFVAVTGITGVPASGTVGIPLTLSGTVAPANASSQAITWSIQAAGTTGATITGNTLNATVLGEVTVRATITNGAAVGTAFTRDFSITVTDFVAVTGITGVPTSGTLGTSLTLSGTVAPANASSQAITWSIQAAGTTGATITGNTLNATVLGEVTVRATIANGAAVGTDFTLDFDITFRLNEFTFEGTTSPLVFAAFNEPPPGFYFYSLLLSASLTPSEVTENILITIPHAQMDSNIDLNAEISGISWHILFSPSGSATVEFSYMGNPAIQGDPRPQIGTMRVEGAGATNRFRISIEILEGHDGRQFSLHYYGEISLTSDDIWERVGFF